MATREEKLVRLELPSTAGVECEIRENVGQDEYILTFYQNDRQLKSCTLLKTKLMQDNLVDLLSDAGVEFFSFSAIFDVANLLLNAINEKFKELPMGEETIIDIPSDDKSIDKLGESESDKILEESQLATETELEIKDKKEISITKTDKLLKKFEMPYSKNGFAGVYYTQDGRYSVVIFEKNTPIMNKIFSKDSIKQDDIVDMITEAEIEFLSFSAIYDTAEQIENIILHPENHIEAKKAEDISEGIKDDNNMVDYANVYIPDSVTPKEDLPTIDLSSFDASEYKDAKDFDKFLEKLTDFMAKGKPLPIKEIDLEKLNGTICIIFRKLDKLFLGFRYKDGSLSNINETKIDRDEIAQIINKNIPQISFSYLYDASEKISRVMGELEKSPIGDVILNVAIAHFLQVIDQYEKEEDLKQAAKVTEVLLERSKREKNVKGVLQFGKKLVYYLEERNKVSKAIKLRNELTEFLLELDIETALNFVLDSLDSLVEQEKYLNAANLCGLILDYYLIKKEDENEIILSNMLMLAKKQVEFYKYARLPVVLWENAIRYGHHAIQLLGKINTLNLDFNQIESFKRDIWYLLDSAFEVQEEKKLYFDLLECLEKTLDLFKITEDRESYSKYIERTILTIESQNNKEKALEITLDASNFLMDSDNYIKACDLANRSIKYFYEMNRIDEAVDFSLNIITGLIGLKKADAARDYLKFVENLIDKAYADDETRRVEKQLTLGDLFGKLGDRDHAKSYIQKALVIIGDPKKREKIVLKYVDNLLKSNALLTAQEMVNLEISRLLNEKKISNVLEFVVLFIDNLKRYEKHDMVFEYMKYSSNLMYQTNTINYELIQSFIKDLVHINAVEHAAFMLESLLAIQVREKDFTRIIDNLTRFIEYLLKNKEYHELVKKYIFQITEAYRQMGDPEGAVERLIAFQKELLEYSIDIAQNITDWVLKELERNEDYKKSIEVVSRMIEKQMELQRYQDAYIFTVQNARYYESLGDIEKVIKYLEQMRDIFLDHKQNDDANRLTDLIIRFGRSHKKYKLVIESVKNYSKESLDRGETETASKFALVMSSLLDEEEKIEKSTDFLQMVFDNIYEKDKPSSLKVLQRILEIKRNKDDFKKIAKKYLEPLLQKHLDLDLIEKVQEILTPSLEEYITFIEKFYDSLLENEGISNDIYGSIANFVDSVFNNGLTKDGDRLTDKYIKKFLDLEQITSATRIMEIFMDKTERPTSEFISFSFNFIKELIDRTLVEGAREFTDRVLNIITTKKKFGNEGRILAARIAEKFAILVAIENPDLASEYIYQASDFYRSLNDFDDILEAFTNLANQYTSTMRVLRIFNSGIGFFKKYNANKHEANLLSRLTKYLIEIKDESALSTFQQTLEKFEGLEDLEQLFDAILLLIEVAIEVDNLDIVYTYIDYLCRLSSMINATDRISSVLIFLSQNAKEKDDKSRLKLVNKYINELGIVTKKHKKEFKELIERKDQKLGKIASSEDKIEKEISKEPEILPKIVESSKFISHQTELTPNGISQEGANERLDEEFVTAIKTFEKETPEEKSSIEETGTSSEEIPIIPDLSSLETISKKLESGVQTEIPVLDTETEQSIEKEASSESNELKIVTSKETTTTETPTLSDDEISNLFSKDFIYSKEMEQTKTEMSLDDITTHEESIEPRKIALSEDEMHSLFESSIIGTKPSEDEDSFIKEREREVNELERLLDKRESLKSEKIEQETIIELSSIDGNETETPDLSILDHFAHEEKEEIKPLIENSSAIEEAVKETQESIVINKSAPAEVSTDTEKMFGKPFTGAFSSVLDSLSEDEKSNDVDIFKMPEVTYEQIIPSELPNKHLEEEKQVKPPDLANLFSNALSELGSINGESGESSEELKKKKRK